MKKQCLGLALILAITVAAPSFGDVTNGGIPADGTSTGTVTSVTYGESGITSVTVTEAGTGKEYTIENGDMGDTDANPNAGNDIDQFGGVLAGAYASGDSVTLKAEGGNLVEVKVKKPKPEPKPDPQPVPGDR